MRHFVFVVALLLHQVMADKSTDLVSKASNEFANQLYQELAKKPGNILVCPLSLHIALTLVHQGAGGNTANELATVLRYSSAANNDIKEGYKSLLTGLKDDVLKIATKMYPAISFKPNQEYVSLAQQYFLSDVEAVDFGNSANAAATINKFVEEKTNNKIHDIISPDSLSDITRLVLVNAVHFKAGWKKTFPPAYDDFFKVTPQEKVQTKFLHQTDTFPYKEDSVLGAKVLKMDYKNDGYSMVFVLPNKEDGLSTLEAKLASTSIESLLSGLNEVRVEVTVPKFKLEQTLKLPEVLKKMGITSMFSPQADLSKIASGENLAVSDVIQKTYIDVNEEGTEAAAATGVIETLSGSFEENIFFARRPFHFYLIQNRAPGLVLFEGRFNKPENQHITNAPKESNHVQTDNKEEKIYFAQNTDENVNSFTTNEFNKNQAVNSNNRVVSNQGFENTQNYNSQTAPQNYGTYDRTGVPQPSLDTRHNYQPGYVQNQPGYVQNQPGYVQNQPGYVQNQPGYVQNQPGYVQNQPGYVQNQPPQTYTVSETFQPHYYPSQEPQQPVQGYNQQQQAYQPHPRYGVFLVPLRAGLGLKYFKVDHPFRFYLVDTPNYILFNGRYLFPPAAEV